MTFPATALWVLLPCLIIAEFGATNGHVACEDDAICAETIREGSTCVDGTCSNPFVSGCLHRYLPDWTRLRTCNSEDPPELSKRRTLCSEPLFDYDEIRVLAQNWDSPMLTSWIYQIVLSELAGVPATVEISSPDLNFNFYDPGNAFHFGPEQYDYDALRTALAYGDCRGAPEGMSCAHVMPEVWNGQRQAIPSLEEEGVIEHSSAAGGAGKYSWYVPRYTAKKDLTLLSHLGLTTGGPNGTDVRRKIAQMFKRPFTWKEYCDRIAADYCSTADDVAKRPPNDEGEDGRYFVSGLFTGFFNATDENDCDANPDTCTGHFTNVPCSFSTFAIQQAYHLKFPVKSNGPGVAGGYPFSRYIEIIDAANATESDVLFYFYVPEPKMQSFFGTSFEMQKISLPAPTLECFDSRVSQAQRCSADPAVRVGDVKGACDSEIDVYQKLIVSDLFGRTYERDSASRSPGYDIVKGLSISDLDLNQIFEYWYQRDTDRWNYDAREAVCRWCAENLDKLERFIPHGYPRLQRETNFDQPYLHAARWVGGLAAILTLFTCACTWFYRNERVMVFAQVDFMYMLLCGLLFICIGGIFYSLTPSGPVCVSRLWLVTLGYSLQLIPLIVKVATINKLFRESSRGHRFKINRKTLYQTVAVFLTIVITYLLVWTVVDPPTPRAVNTLTDDANTQGGLYVDVSFTCSSRSDAWQTIKIVCHLTLLLVMAVLSFQSRNVRQEFNEASRLAFTIYSLFIFTLLRAAIFFSSSTIEVSIVSCINSLALSFDCIAMLGIYFAPKLIEARWGPASQAAGQTVGKYLRGSLGMNFRETTRPP